MNDMTCLLNNITEYGSKDSNIVKSSVNRKISKKVFKRERILVRKITNLNAIGQFWMRRQAEQNNNTFFKNICVSLSHHRQKGRRTRISFHDVAA